MGQFMVLTAAGCVQLLLVGTGSQPSHCFIRNQSVMILYLICMTLMTYILTFHRGVLTSIPDGRHLRGE